MKIHTIYDESLRFVGMLLKDFNPDTVKFVQVRRDRPSGDRSYKIQQDGKTPIATNSDGLAQANNADAYMLNILSCAASHSAGTGYSASFVVVTARDLSCLRKDKDFMPREQCSLLYSDPISVAANTQGS